jgi:hypothetical protein
MLKTRLPSAFRRCAPMGPPVASYVPTMSSRNGEHSSWPSSHLYSGGADRAARSYWHLEPAALQTLIAVRRNLGGEVVAAYPRLPGELPNRNDAV